MRCSPVREGGGGGEGGGEEWNTGRYIQRCRKRKAGGGEEGERDTKKTREVSER